MELGDYCCKNCNMAFRSQSLLEKHWEKFCIGSHIGDPYALNSRYLESLKNGTGPYSTTKIGTREAEMPDLMRSNEKLNIRHLRAREDVLREREKSFLLGYEPWTSMGDSVALKRLTDEFQKLRTSIEESLPTLKSFQPEQTVSPLIQRDREYRERLQEMEDAHQQHLASIQARNRNLEELRGEIHKRLSEMASQAAPTSHIEQMLMELKVQEEKNQMALDALKDQIERMQTENRAKPVKMDLKEEKVPLIPFSSNSGPLSSEIRALYLSYLQNGGSDPNVLAQLYDLQMEVTVFERTGKKPEHKETKKRPPQSTLGGLDSDLLAVEFENQQLEDEILKLQVHRDKRKVNNGYVNGELASMQWEHLQHVVALQSEIQQLKRDSSRIHPHIGPPLLPPPVAPPAPPLPPPPPPPLPPPFTLRATELVRPQTPVLGKHVLDVPEVLGPAPYDPAAGFVIFYDFLMGLDPTFVQVRLVTGLYASGQEMSQTTLLPAVFCEMGQASQYMLDVRKGTSAILSVKQPVPRVRPVPSLALVVELQASGGFDTCGQEVQCLSSRGWTKIDLFDQHNQVLSGHWKVPIRALPVRTGLTMGELNMVPQVGTAELYLRVVNARDADMQSLAETDPRNISMYKYPALISSRIAPPVEQSSQGTLYPSPPNPYFSPPFFTDCIDPPPVQEQPSKKNRNQRVDGAVTQKQTTLHPQWGEPEIQDLNLGFIVDRVRGAPLGNGSLRLTGYHQKTGQVIRTKESIMNCFTSLVQSNIKHGYFIFGEQELMFHGVNPLIDMILIIRLYLWPDGSVENAPWDPRSPVSPLLGSEEWVVAWSALRLTKAAALLWRKEKHAAWNTGIHELSLYHCPVPHALNLSVLPGEHHQEMFEPYGSASVRLCVFSGRKPNFPFPAESPVSLSQERPPDLYVQHHWENLVSEPFASTDGCDLYIDGARFLPDIVTISRVTGRIFDRTYNQIGPDISTGIDLNSSVFEPQYNYLVQIRKPGIPASATLLLKLYSIERFSLQLVLIGWAALNLFVESGTQNFPKVDSGGVQVSLNEGAHQLRLYHRGPALDQPLSVQALTHGGRYIPCASLLVRVVKAPVDKAQRTLHRQEAWMKVGLIQPQPAYKNTVYYSDSVLPTSGETQLYSTMASRPVMLVREIALLLSGREAQKLSSDEKISEWIQKKLNLTLNPTPFNLSCISHYLPSHGIKVAVDCGINLPWSGFPAAHFCLNPPGAFYFGQPWLRYDYPVFLEDVDLNSSQQFPVWLDGFKPYHFSYLLHALQLPDLPQLQSHPLLPAMCKAWKLLCKMLQISSRRTPCLPIAGNGDFLPGLDSTVFRRWSSAGLQYVSQAVQHTGSPVSFTDLQTKFRLLPTDWFAYRQLQHYLQTLTPTMLQEDVKDRLQEAISLTAQEPIPLRFYHKWLQERAGDLDFSTLAQKWSIDLQLPISADMIRKGIRLGNASAVSSVERERNYKFLLRAFCTPRRAHVMGISAGHCCGKCAYPMASFGHMFWTCPLVSSFWIHLVSLVARLWSCSWRLHPSFFFHPTDSFSPT
uniref:Coiled-coil domain-containing protein 17 isoform X2 n=1 Tax=Geotrypetes seraphini TaxID=260995 RepID=A0A6P8P8D7_GEOSA|nr:coiled-coil domain-containing protein 17 isoform X2 [Geotrypetes seraphini]